MASRTENAERGPQVKVVTKPKTTQVQPPDGGWGWVVCFAGFMVNFTVQGMTCTNGIILLGTRDLFNGTISEATPVSSVNSAAAMFGGPLVVALLYCKASHRQIIMLGGITAAASTIASAFAPKIEMLIFTHGIAAGLSMAIAFFASNVILGCYFDKRLAIAVGITNSGSGVGSMLLNYLTERSIEFYGMRGTFLLIGGVLLNLTVYGSLCRPLKSVIKSSHEISESARNSEDRNEELTNLGFTPEEENTETQVEKSATLCSKSIEGTETMAEATSCSKGIEGTETMAEATSCSKGIEGTETMAEATSCSKGIEGTEPMAEATSCSKGIEGTEPMAEATSCSKGIEGTETMAETLEKRRLSTYSQQISNDFENQSSCCCVTMIFRNKTFLLLLAIYFLWAVGEPLLIYLPAYAESVGLSREESALIMSIFGIMSTISQILLGFLADVIHIPISFLLLSSLFGMSLSILFLSICKTFATLAAITIAFSIFFSFGIALRVILVASLLGTENLSAGYSAMTILVGIGYVVYPYINGCIYDVTSSFNLILYTNSAITFVGAILSSGVIYAQKKGKFD